MWWFEMQVRMTKSNARGFIEVTQGQPTNIMISVKLRGRQRYMRHFLTISGTSPGASLSP